MKESENCESENYETESENEEEYEEYNRHIQKELIVYEVSDIEIDPETAVEKRIRTLYEKVRTRFKQEIIEFPKEFICIISQRLILDPVYTVLGTTYNRKHIKLWFRNSNKDPITNTTLTNKNLYDNKTIAKKIIDFLIALDY